MHPHSSLAGVLAGALLAAALVACGDTTSPVAPSSLAATPTAATLVANAAKTPQRRPLQYSQSWDANSSDPGVPPCVVQVPNPAAPGSFIPMPFHGLIRGTGLASHWGRHSVEIRTTSCAWNAELGKASASGPFRAVSASGDTVWGTWAFLATLGPTGGDGNGTMHMLTGTGRFAEVSGEATLHVHDNPDGSGYDEGSGWIVY